MFLFLLGHYLSERTFSLNASPGCELPHDGEMDPGSLQQHLIQLLTPSRELRSEFVKTQSVITIHNPGLFSLCTPFTGLLYKITDLGPLYH